MKKKIISTLCCVVLLIAVLVCAYMSGRKSIERAGSEAAQSSEETVTAASDSTENNSADIVKAESSDTAASASPSGTTQIAEEKDNTVVKDSSSKNAEARTTPSPTASPTATPSPTPSPTPSFTVESWTEEKTMYAKSPVNVRKGPSTDYELCGHLNGSDAVTVKGVADTGWYLISIGEEDGFVSNKYLLDTPPTPVPVAEQAAVPQPATPAQPAAPATAQPAPAPTPAPAPKVVAGTIFVGDSRFVQMHEVVGETGVTWIHENGKGYDWFVEKAIPRIDNLVGKGTKILINLGVNDPEHYNSYITMVNGKAGEWTQKGATVYYASVNPVWENPYTTKEEVITFNEKVSAGLSGVHWIDSYTYLMENGCRIVDGLHYSEDTSAVIYNYYITAIQ